MNHPNRWGYPPIPSDALPPGETRTLVALVEEWTEARRATVRAVAHRSGLAASTTSRHVRTLRSLGLADYDDDLTGTLRPNVKIVAVFP